MNLVLSIQFARFFYGFISPVFFVFTYTPGASCQAGTLLSYTMQNVLSHNDYQKGSPFFNAYKHGVGIMEADLFFHDGKVLVAHDRSELELEWDLETMYIKPMRAMIERIGGIYPETGKTLALMLDIKNYPDKIMNWILNLVKQYPVLFGNNSTKSKVSIIISGHRPNMESWDDLPESVFIDGRLTDEIPVPLRHKVFMVSSSLSYVIKDSWSPVQLTTSQIEELSKAIDSVHKQNLKIRFWGVPDNHYFWQLQDQLGVDIIGSDHLDELAKEIGSGQ